MSEEKDKGWICPGCKTVYSPQVKTCTNPDCPIKKESVDPKKDSRQLLTE